MGLHPGAEALAIWKSKTIGAGRRAGPNPGAYLAWGGGHNGASSCKPAGGTQPASRRIKGILGSSVSA